MTLGKNEAFTGLVIRKLINIGSKSEHEAIMLDRGDGQPLELRVKGGNPFQDPALAPFVGQRVRVVGVTGSGVPQIFVDNAADITVLGPPGKPMRPPKP